MNMIYLIARIISAIIVSIYFVERFKKYIENRKNNNITGDVLFRWESVSLIDKYHIRERFFGGSRLRIKRDARRREIKYYWIAYIPSITLIVFSFIQDMNIYVDVLSKISALFTVKVLFDRIEGKRLIGIIVTACMIIIGFVGYALIAGNVFITVKFSHIFKKFLINGKALGIQPSMYIPLCIIILIMLYSIIKNRWLSLFMCVMAIIATVISVGITSAPGIHNYLLIYYVGYLYVSLIIMQYIYNIRALKKITFIN